MKKLLVVTESHTFSDDKEELCIPEEYEIRGWIGEHLAVVRAELDVKMEDMKKEQRRQFDELKKLLDGTARQLVEHQKEFERLEEQQKNLKNETAALWKAQQALKQGYDTLVDTLKKDFISQLGGDLQSNFAPYLEKISKGVEELKQQGEENEQKMEAVASGLRKQGDESERRLGCIRRELEFSAGLVKALREGCRAKISAAQDELSRLDEALSHSAGGAQEKQGD